MSEGDILVRRVENGFVATRYMEDGPREAVFEESDDWAGAALVNLIWWAWPEEFQSKHRGGITISLKRKGTDDE